jgi:hypothetical protein
MVNALFNNSENGNMSMHDRDCEWLRRQAYIQCSLENADIKKIDKIINGIKDGEINKNNLFEEVRKLTRNITSDHSIKRWQIIVEWFDKNNWF